MNLNITNHLRGQLEEIAKVCYPSLPLSQAFPLIIAESYKRLVLAPAAHKKRMAFFDTYREPKPVLSLH